MPAIASFTGFRCAAPRVAATILLLLAQVLTPLHLGSIPVFREVGSMQGDTVPPPPSPAEYYILTPIIADGMSADQRKDLTRAFFEEASSQLADRINEKDSDFSAVRDCGTNPTCEVVSLQIKQESGQFSYEIKSKLINGSGPARHPDIAPSLSCSINTGEPGSEPLRVCHRKFLLWYAGKLVSHDKAWHGVNQ